MNIKNLKLITKELTGLNLKISDDCCLYQEHLTGIKVHNSSNTIVHIQINIWEIKKSDVRETLQRLGHTNTFIKVLLHEIAHIKQLKKAVSFDIFALEYHYNPHYYEDVADRYAKLNYKKVLLALDKREKVCYAK